MTTKGTTMSYATSARLKPPLRFRVLDAPVKPLAAFGNLAKRSLAILLFCIAWQILPRSGLVDRVFLPPFSEVIEAAWHLLRSGTLEQNAAASLYRSFSGLALAIVTAVPAGLMLGWDRRIGSSSTRYWRSSATRQHWRSCRSSH